MLMIVQEHTINSFAFSLIRTHTIIYKQEHKKCNFINSPKEALVVVEWLAYSSHKLLKEGSIDVSKKGKLMVICRFLKVTYC